MEFGEGVEVWSHKRFNKEEEEEEEEEVEEEAGGISGY